MPRINPAYLRAGFIMVTVGVSLATGPEAKLKGQAARRGPLFGADRGFWILPAGLAQAGTRT